MLFKKNTRMDNNHQLLSQEYILLNIRRTSSDNRCKLKGETAKAQKFRFLKTLIRKYLTFVSAK